MTNKNNAKTKIRDSIEAARIHRTAELIGVSTDLVYKVRNGLRNNIDVLEMLIFLQEGENKLVEEAKNLVQFNKTNPV